MRRGKNHEAGLQTNFPDTNPMDIHGSNSTKLTHIGPDPHRLAVVRPRRSKFYFHLERTMTWGGTPQGIVDIDLYHAHLNRCYSNRRVLIEKEIQNIKDLLLVKQ